MRNQPMFWTDNANLNCASTKFDAEWKRPFSNSLMRKVRLFLMVCLPNSESSTSDAEDGRRLCYSESTSEKFRGYFLIPFELYWQCYIATQTGLPSPPCHHQDPEVPFWRDAEANGSLTCQDWTSTPLSLAWSPGRFLGTFSESSELCCRSHL